MTLSLPETSRGLSGCSAFAILLALGLWGLFLLEVVLGQVPDVLEILRLFFWIQVRFLVGTTILWMRCRRNADAIELRLRLLERLDPKDTEFVLAVVGETDPENAETVLAAAGETDSEVVESVRSLAGSVDRELRRSGPSVRKNAHATASESTGIIGSRDFGGSESSLPNSDNSSMGVACVDLASAAVASLAPVCSSPRSRVACAAGAVHARRTVSPMHAAHSHNSWSDTVGVKSIPPTTENWLRKRYNYSMNNDKSTEDKHETNHINNKCNDMNTRKMHIT